jgi:hypothetical protein
LENDVKKKFVVETVSTFYEVHLVEAENEDEAKFIVANSDYNASKWLGQQVASVNEFDERDMPRLRKLDTYFFDGYATIENDYLVYRKMNGELNGNMPHEKVR